MIISDIKFAEYSLQFKSLFRSSKNSFTHKNIVLLKIISSEGKEYFGEVSLMPELGTETKEAAIKELNRIKTDINSIDDLKIYLENLSGFPAVSFCLGQILFNLEKTNFESKEVEINSLVGIDTNGNTLEYFKENYNSGFRSFKLKFGGKEFHEELKLLEQLRKTYDQSIKLRLDVNGKWDFNEAIKKLNVLDEYKIEYVEQPVERLTDLRRLISECDVKIAADESANNFQNTEKIIIDSPVEIIVLKPILIGEVNKIFDLIDLAKAHDKSIVISSTFESAIGLNMLIHLANYAGSKYAHGLGTFLHLHSEINDAEFSFVPPKISLQESSMTNFVLPNLHWQ